MKMGLVKINMDVDIFSSDNLGPAIEKDWVGKTWTELKMLGFFSFLSNNDAISIFTGDVRPTSSVSTYL